MTCKFLLDENGNAAEIITSAHDISDRRRVMERLTRNEEKYRHMIENLSEAVYCIDLEGVLSYISPTIQTMLGFDPAEVKGKHFREFLYPEDIEKGLRHFTFTLKSAIAPVECRFLNKAGEIVWLYASSVPVFDKDGKVKGIQGILQNVTASKQRESELQQANEKLREAISGTVQVMASIIELKDSYTAKHQLRVTKLACAIAREIKMSTDQIDAVRAASLVHDIGKLNIPVSILSKTGAINEIEYEMIKKHPQTGHDLLQPIGFPWAVSDIVLQHHERLDGSGYPRGLEGPDILSEAKVLAVADVVEAISTPRPYREQGTIASALEEISLNKGSLYDSSAVDACLKLFLKKRFTF